MNPQRVTATNFRSWATLDWLIPEGCAAIIGENGAGKSSLLSAIDIALFGGRLERFLKRGETEMQVTVEFEHGEPDGDFTGVYRVRRHYSGRGRGKASLDFHRQTMSAEWLPCGGENMAATQALIEQTIGVTRETWRASAYLAQGDAAAFTDAKPAERKAILGEILGLDTWETLLAMVRGDRREAWQGIATQTARQADLAERAALLPDLTAEEQRLAAVRAGVVKSLDDARAALTAEQEAASGYAEAQAVLRQAQAASDAAVDAHRSANALRTGMEARLARGEARLAQREQYEATAAGLEAALAEKASYEEAVQQWRLSQAAASAAARHAEAASREAAGARTRMEEAAARGGRVREELARIAALAEEVDPACETCGQSLTDPLVRADVDRKRAERVDALTEELNAARATYAAERAAAEEAEAAKQEAEAERAKQTVAAPEGDAYIESRILAAREAAKEIAALDEVAATLERERPELEAARAAEQAADATRRDAGVWLAAAAVALPPAPKENGWREIVEEATEYLRKLDFEAGQVAGRLREAQEAAALARKLADDLAPARREHDVLEALERAYGRDGIPALIVESAALPAIETEAGRILEALGTSYRVELRTQKALKTSDGLRETLDIVVLDGGSEALFEDFSGGERMKLNLALRIGLARLLAHRRGADIRMLAIDEPEYLDEGSVERLALVLQQTLQDDFDRILLVSHIPSLREAFESVVEVGRGPDGSSVLA